MSWYQTKSAAPSAPPGISGGRLDPQFLERTFSENSPVPNAVQCNATSHDEIRQPCKLVSVARRPEHDLFGDFLDGRGDIHLPLRERAFHRSRWAAKELVHLLRGHDLFVAIGEVGHVHPKRAVGPQVEELVAHEGGIFGLAIRRKTHQLVLAAIDAKTTEISESGVKKPERMRKTELLEEPYPIPFPDADAACRPLADAVERQDGCLVERGREKSASGMRLVMAGEDVASSILSVQSKVQLPRCMQLLL